ncbi:MAG: Cof-type HAD-IIB family hydrolase [Solobacterium sp.]|nr:Cof-type HAD-IIB family hydrolase [Solobacterium sp.]
MREYKVVVADIDRTLRDKNDEFGDINRKAFQELHRRGVKLGLASGRPLWQKLMHHAEEWGLGFQFDFIIGLNGGEIYDDETKETIKLNPLQPESIKEIVTKMEPTNCNPFIYREGYMLARWDDDLLKASAARNKNASKTVKELSELWEEPIGKIMYRTHSAEEMDTIVAPYAKTIENDIFFSFKTRVDLLVFQDRRNNKGNATAEYCRRHGISMEDVMAFGDAENDMEMMQMAGYSVCLCNGMKENKEIADAVTEYPAGEDGFGRWLFDHYF